ncbi:MlaD family protein [Conexibacter sp. JD483]|uniref:MlaD family protein n=1 Tax=unclassified Conexibacter TaxID=2627773 RepID=UPI002728548F|nr:MULTISPECIES: MlaD family protein [unclassified Conexibacter]MDO8186154.1 MlaD family protein [Conexibacter sp. CPCC 205706]MDO8199644.1 MlaD family protein [Conexibacter sp. CPCC 205762]MDR9369102.1 MlaD family protein [Conexibacter sp. JD483]
MTPARRTTAPTRRRQWSRFRIGLIALIVLVIPIYLAFAKHIPFTHGYRVNAVFETSNNLRPNSPVRIAGVNVGRVKSVSRYKDTNLSEVTMEIEDKGLPIHKDATAKIRPRIFLEGNFFVDLQPGTPGSPDIDSGGTIPVTQTSTPVQLDQLLTALQSDSREDLQHVLEEYGAALNSKPTAEQDSELPPEVQGLTGAEAINRSYDNAGPALQGTAVVNDALRGERPGDLARTIAGIARLARTLDSREGQLQDLIVNFSLTASAFANQSGNLSATLQELPPTLRTARSALNSVDRALPSVRAFAKEILPGVKQTAATVDASFPWIEQTRALLGPDELQGLMAELTPTTQDLARLTSASIELLPQLDDFSQCFDKVILPAGNVKLDDGALTTRRSDGSVVEAYKEFWYGLAGMAASGQSFDGNGQMLRASAAGGQWQWSPGRSRFGNTTFVGNTTERPLGTRPLYPSSPPLIRTDRACKRSGVPNLNGPQAGPGEAPTSVVVPIAPPIVRRTETTTETTTGTTPAAGTSALATAGETDSAATDAAADTGAIVGSEATPSLGAQLLSRLNPLANGGGR